MAVGRRDFLKGAGVTSRATAATTGTVAEAGPAAAGAGGIAVI